MKTEQRKTLAIILAIASLVFILNQNGGRAEFGQTGDDITFKYDYVYETSSSGRVSAQTPTLTMGIYSTDFLIPDYICPWEPKDRTDSETKAYPVSPLSCWNITMITGNQQDDIPIVQHNILATQTPVPTTIPVASFIESKVTPIKMNWKYKAPKIETTQSLMSLFSREATACSANTAVAACGGTPSFTSATTWTCGDGKSYYFTTDCKAAQKTLLEQEKDLGNFYMDNVNIQQEIKLKSVSKIITIQADVPSEVALGESIYITVFINNKFCGGKGGIIVDDNAVILNQWYVNKDIKIDYTDCTDEITLELLADKLGRHDISITPYFTFDHADFSIKTTKPYTTSYTVSRTGSSARQDVPEDVITINPGESNEDVVDANPPEERPQDVNPNILGKNEDQTLLYIAIAVFLLAVGDLAYNWRKK